MKIELLLDNPDNEFVQNMIMRDELVSKVPGTDRLNQTPLDSKIRWTSKYYGIKANKTFIKKLFCASSGKIYVANEVDKVLTEVRKGLSRKGNPESVVLQVAGNSREYFLNGYDVPYYYEGNDKGTWTKSTITYRFVQGVEHDRRLFAFERNSSILHFSRAGYPEDYTATYGGSLTVGNAKDSIIRRILKLGDYIYVFKSNAIYRVLGNTQSTYRVEVVCPYMGLLAQKGACVVNGVIVFVSQQDKEVYEFNTSPVPRQLSGDTFYFSFLEEADPTKYDDIDCVWDRRNNLFRLTYNNKAVDEAHQTNEVCFPSDDIGSDGQPKWFDTYGASISCYCMADRQGDNELITGRSDTGVLMYHNRSQNWDNSAMECILRTDNIPGKEGFNTQFDSIFIKGTPSNGTITLRTYLNDRHSTRTSQSISDLGERRTVGSLSMSEQDTFNNWSPLLTGYNFGETLKIEFYDNTLNKPLELEKIILDVTVRDEVMSELVG